MNRPGWRGTSVRVATSSLIFLIGNITGECISVLREDTCRWVAGCVWVEGGGGMWRDVCVCIYVHRVHVE